tara:strand:+ start:876 stop:1487 length:612 start_codon:yes stop_codon:yes gene_type:complete
MNVTIGKMKDSEGNCLPDITLQICGVRNKANSFAYALFKATSRPITSKNSHFHSLSIAEKLIASEEVTTRIVPTMRPEESDIFLDQDELAIIEFGALKRVPLDVYINKNVPVDICPSSGKFTGVSLIEYKGNRYLTDTKNIIDSFFESLSEHKESVASCVVCRHEMVDLGRIAQQVVREHEQREMPNIISDIDALLKEDCAVD